MFTSNSRERKSRSWTCSETCSTIRASSSLLSSAAKEGVTNAAIEPELAMDLFFGMIFAQIGVARMRDGLPAAPDELGQDHHRRYFSME